MSGTVNCVAALHGKPPSQANYLYLYSIEPGQHVKEYKYRRTVLSPRPQLLRRQRSAALNTAGRAEFLSGLNLGEFKSESEMQLAKRLVQSTGHLCYCTVRHCTASLPVEYKPRKQFV